MWTATQGNRRGEAPADDTSSSLRTTAGILRAPLLAIGGLLLAASALPLSAAGQPDLALRLSAPSQARPGEDIGPRVRIAVYNLGSGVARGTRSAGKNGYMVDLFLTRGPVP
ncbi:MAG TPA: hypothetical protein ENI96_03200, partial [Sedimenticola thiotaurini]|nr:hypothetical protein [Sedimenticola thiotaurini]